ncbi:MAG: phage tail protein [Akkermansiaceae bacterium]
MTPFIAQIMMFGGNFAPRGWAFCDGQLLAISSNTALFSLIGTYYGGDGRTTFALPDLRGRVPIHPGNGPGLSSYQIGQKGGGESKILTGSNIPSHTHPATSTAVNTVTHDLTMKTSSEAEERSPDGLVLAATAASIYGEAGAGLMETGAVAGTITATTEVTTTVGNNPGGNIPIEIIQPFSCVNFIIALQGVFPSRS